MALSRLERLFVLLDTGTTPVTRKAAAQQLGEVQRLHPHELHNLLAKVLTYLRSHSWDTRIAAGQAIEAIVKHVCQWKPPPKSKSESLSVTPASERDYEDHLTFSRFDIFQLLQRGTSLVGSTGSEFDVSEDKDLDPRERVARQRRALQKKLGLDVGGALGITTEDLFDDEDLATTCSPSQGHGRLGALLVPAADIIRSDLQGMSSRQKNKAKRLAKLQAKQKSKEHNEAVPPSEAADGEPEEKRLKTCNLMVEQPENEDNAPVEMLPERSTLFEESNAWPFESFCEELCNDLFSPSWEIRHGAGTGLREILKFHAQSGGKLVNSTSEEESLSSTMEEQHQRWLEDLAIRLLCVFALDRFGDFVSDEVVAPVRETCAQTLGVALQFMVIRAVHSTVSVLLQLLHVPQWEVRHGGLLGLKYALAVRQDMMEHLMPRVIPAMVEGLQDQDDDVRSVAAAALVPVADRLLQLQPDKILVIVNTLWDSLLELDDLTASTNSVMTLLSSLLTFPQVQEENAHKSFTVLVPRVWPFLYHSNSSVRRAALDTLLATLGSHDTQSCVLWLTPILQDMMRVIYQAAILESNQDICNLIQKVWQQLLSKAPLHYVVAAACPWMGAWLCLMMQPAHLPIEHNMLMELRIKSKERSSGKLRVGQSARETRHEYIAGSESLHEDPATRDYLVMRSRLLAARLLGSLTCCLCDAAVNLPSQEVRPAESFAQLLMFYLNSKSALQRIAVALIFCQWAEHSKPCSWLAETVQPRLLAMLPEQLYYDEIAIPFTRMQAECKQLLSGLVEVGIDLRPKLATLVFTIDQASNLVGTMFSEAVGLAPSLSSLKKQMLECRRQAARCCVQETRAEWQSLHARVSALVACAVLAGGALPEKLNPVVKPMMEAARHEENVLLQSFVAEHIAKLLQLSACRKPCPNPKIVKNLASWLCMDPVHTPSAACPISDTVDGGKGDKERQQHTVDKSRGIITLYRSQKAASALGGRRGPAPRSRVVPTDIPHGSLPEQEGARSDLVQRRGAELTLCTVARWFGSGLVRDLPCLWEAIIGPLNSQIPQEALDASTLQGDDDSAQTLICCLQLWEVICPALHPELLSQLLDLLPRLCTGLQHPFTAVRHMVARVLALLCRLDTSNAVGTFLERVLPWLGASHDDSKREGAIESLACVMEQLEIELVPYLLLLVVPVLGRMSDQTESVRLMATHCFATLIRLMPLEVGIPNPPGMPEALVKQKERERKFLQQLMDGSQLEPYTMPVPIYARLRTYQQEGVNWLAFLNKYKLHGILCDDMGLGKTLQSICILAGDHYSRTEEHKLSHSVECAPLPSLVVCPPTLTGHWVDEVQKFCSPEYLHPLHYTGPPAERARLQRFIKKHNLVVASYDVVRNDIDFFKNIRWNYCILDEGHIIKNGKTKLSKAVKQVTANHRLILSGTPIQNNVLELWSLFDFLMPGFLGTEHQFAMRYGKPILASRDAKSSSREQEAGVLAMEALHRQVLPFLLRRMKEDVLQDLPPKIIQDYYCNLSPLQVRLYEDFARSHAKKDAEETLSSAPCLERQEPAKKKATGHVFQALQYLRKLCNHPALVLTPQHPEFQRITEELASEGSSLRDIQHTPKLSALKQLLLDCGLGGGSGGEDAAEAVVAQHRVLLFCQLKSMLDIVEHDLLRPLLPTVSFLRLDGSVPAGQRHTIVSRFNNDPSIDVLLLTTHVGGLGLNLTGADTVVFVEHDWNPMRDLQAMDRAHRIGQKRVVNVYRLITRGTLEEKIMGLQKFKLSIANTVISQENTSLQSMGTEQLLDLFTLEGGDQEKSKGESSSGRKQTMKSILENLGELWDREQYESEYNLDSFMQSLEKPPRA